MPLDKGNQWYFTFSCALLFWEFLPTTLTLVVFNVFKRCSNGVSKYFRKIFFNIRILALSYSIYELLKDSLCVLFHCGLTNAEKSN